MKGDMEPNTRRQVRVFAPLTDLEVHDSGAGEGLYTITSMPIVFNSWSLPLGWSGFYERIAPGATRGALDEDPHVVSLWDHNTSLQLGSTLNGTLDLTELDEGVRAWTRVAPTSYAADLRILLERGDITQCSFAFTIEKETWQYQETDGKVDRIETTIEEISELFDVTVCAMGAYPDTSLVVTDSLKSSHDRLETALREGRVNGLTLDRALERGLISVNGPVTEDPERSDAGSDAVASGGEAREFNLAHARAQVQSARALLP
jgi:uncharacterized protein